MQKQNGFTLVELAIALMVIGLLIGGILKGQEVITNARITRTASDLNSIDTATMIFYNTYGDLPGDIANPAGRLPNCKEARCTTSGNANGIVNRNANSSLFELSNFFCHMRVAGLLTDAIAPLPCNPTHNDSLYAKMPSLGGSLRITYTAPDGSGGDSTDAAAFGIANGRHHYYFGEKRQITLSAITAAALDTKIDDGLPRTGEMQVHTSQRATCTVAASGSIPSEYNKAVTGPLCGILIHAKGTRVH